MTQITVPLSTITLSPGSALTLRDIDWPTFTQVLEALGDTRKTHIAYWQGRLELMAPSARHERPHRMAGYIITALLDSQGRAWEDFGSTSFQRVGVAGVEPDTCFYIDNVATVRDCRGRVDVDHYPPPDLAIKSDITSKTLLEAYRALAVPEVWVLTDQDRLTIYTLADPTQDRLASYQVASTSPLFPGIDITTLVPHLISQALTLGTSTMLREFRHTLLNP